MDKSVVFAVAESGKTTRLVLALDETRRFLLVTYTETNHANLRAKVIEHFGYLPPNISIYTYFRFLHSFCYRPFLRSEKNTLGITDSYEDVCVVLSPTNVKAWNAGSFRDINPETRNKLYVACSRARENLIFVPESLLKAYKGK